MRRVSTDHHPHRRFVTAGLVIGLAITGVSAQNASPQFEAVSVKPNRSNDPTQTFSVTPGSYVVTNMTARMLIRQAYRVQDYQIADAPGWTESDRFDVKARASLDATAAMLPDMVRAMLEDRFGLVARREMRETPVYELVLDKPDTLGPRLRRTSPEASAACAVRRTSSTAPSRSDGLPCGIGTKGTTITAGDSTLGPLTGLLSPLVGRVTVDRTGLAGTFDFDLIWTADELAAGPASQAAAPAAPTLLTALREQLGLRLNPQRAQAQVLVIDRIRQPSED
jgi:uncharacterized protein (TIGR03435 family)